MHLYVVVFKDQIGKKKARGNLLVIKSAPKNLDRTCKTKALCKQQHQLFIMQ